MKNQTVIVFVTDEDRSQEFTKETNLVVFGADKFRDALSQTIFSYPDAIVIDASSDMLRAEDTFFHLRTINHPPIVVMSNIIGRWEMRTGNPVVVIPEDSTDYQIEEAVRALIAGNIKAVS